MNTEEPLPASRKPFVLALMPFSKGFEDAYNLGIKAACHEEGAYCERVDEQIFTGNIVGRIVNQISKADLIVADMSEQNPNVFYETGYAHALGKRVILVTKHVDDIPFDLKQYPHIIYGSSLTLLKDELKRRLAYFLAHRDAPKVAGIWALEFFQDGAPLVDGGSVAAYLTSNGHLSIVLDVHNPTFTRFMGQQHGVAAAIPFIARDPTVGKERCSKLEDGRYLAPLPFIKNIFPEGWASYRFDLKPYSHRFELGKETEVELRVYSDQGVRELRLLATASRSASYANADEDERSILGYSQD